MLSDAIEMVTAPNQLRCVPLSATTADRSRWTRVAAGVGGSALVAVGLKRRSVGGAAIAVGEGWLAYRAIGSGLEAGDGTAVVTESITIGEPADELSDRARDAETLDRLVGPVATISAIDEDRHRWTVRDPLGLSWETQLVEAQPGERLRWEPTDGPALIDDWSMSFQPAPGDRGTEVTLETRFAPPAGIGGTAIEALDVVPETFAGAVLDRFKSLAETGEIPTTAGNPSARGRGDLA